MANIGKSGTFALNRTEPVHRWYSYVEGYSSCLVERELDKILCNSHKISKLYDPFNGTGTTGLVGSMRGIIPYYSESNPFMQLVAETKTNSIKEHRPDDIIPLLNKYAHNVTDLKPSTCTTWDGFEKFFELEQLQHVLAIQTLISSEKDTAVRNILMLALSSVLVRASKMIRRGDLRYATEKEYQRENVNTLFIAKIEEIIEDLPVAYARLVHPLTKISDDARDNNLCDDLDCVITSPPYLNGTNYIRNTKLELKLNGFIKSEQDLPAYHSKGIVSGINNISKRTGFKPILTEVSSIIDEITDSAYDERIPKMITGYFYDMNDVISSLAKSLKNDGYFIMDIGDSQFGGIHIPTHDILSELARKHGFRKYSEEIIRERRSKNGMVLSQRILRFRLEK